MRTNVPQALRAMRRRRGWRQADLGARAGLTRDVVSRLERDEMRGVTLGSLARVGEALGATVVVELRWRGADLDQLIDRAHAALVTAAATRLEQSGWSVRAEVSFNHFGDRGRCDLVAWHPASRTLLVVEAKTRLGNLQETLGRLDVKRRLGLSIGAQVGWDGGGHAVAALVLAEGGANRRVLHAHGPAFRQFDARGRAAFAWLRRPTAPANGLLWFESPGSDQGRTPRRSASPGRQQVG
jgi:transcriptional regulator with XRE-family HTH domain